MYPELTPIDIINNYFSSLLPTIGDVILRLIGALIIFFIGWLIAILIKIVVEFILRNIKIESLLRSLKLDQHFKDFSWEERLDSILAEVAFWIILVIFLMVAFDVLGLSTVSKFLQSALSYIPKAIVGGLILVAGFVFGELARKVLFGAFRGLNKQSAKSASLFVKYSIVIFAILAALFEWGIGRDIISILITGIIFFLALAGGLSFGLGGQEIAREILLSLKNKISQQE